MENYTPMESEFCSLEHDLYKLIIDTRILKDKTKKIANTICCDTMLS